MTEATGTFIARTSGSSEENGVLTAGVGENADGSGRALFFMSPLPGERDAMISVCDETGATADGHLVLIRLTE